MKMEAVSLEAVHTHTHTHTTHLVKENKIRIINIKRKDSNNLKIF